LLVPTTQEGQAKMPVAGGNIFTDVPRNLAAEQFAELLSAPYLRTERIVSTGRSGPPGHSDDRNWAEWVFVLQGSGKLLLEGETELHLLGRGDYRHIPSRARHGVEWTSPGEPIVWLAVHRQTHTREA
jgi:cupin 2 domain-containing protein